MALKDYHNYLLIYLLTYLLPHLITPWSTVLLEKLTGFQLAKKFPAFCSTRRFITAFTSVRHLSINPHFTSWRSILILSSHLSLNIQIVSFPHVSPPEPCNIPLLSPIRATWPAHLILLEFITPKILGEEYRSLSSSLCSFLHSLVTSSLVVPNIPLSTLLSNTLSLRSSFNVIDQVSHPYKPTGKFILTLIINQQMHYIKFHIKTLKIAPTCFVPKIILRELCCSLLKSF